MLASAALVMSSPNGKGQPVCKLCPVLVTISAVLLEWVQETGSLTAGVEWSESGQLQLG